MTCVCVLLAQWIAAFLMPSGLVFLALRPTSLWDYALIWSGLLSAPLHALVVKFLLPALARGQVSYLAALVGCLCGALVASAVFMAEISSAGTSRHCSAPSGSSARSRPSPSREWWSGHRRTAPPHPTADSAEHNVKTIWR
jgi:hypothetical protein